MRRRHFLIILGGAAAAAPFAARAQQQEWPVVGWLSIRSSSDSGFAIDAFNQGLKEAGYVQGENVTIEYRWAENKIEGCQSLRPA